MSQLPPANSGGAGGSGGSSGSAILTGIEFINTTIDPTNYIKTAIGNLDNSVLTKAVKDMELTAREQQIELRELELKARESKMTAWELTRDIVSHHEIIEDWADGDIVIRINRKKKEAVHNKYAKRLVLTSEFNKEIARAAEVEFGVTDEHTSSGRPTSSTEST